MIGRFYRADALSDLPQSGVIWTEGKVGMRAVRLVGVHAEAGKEADYPFITHTQTHTQTHTHTHTTRRHTRRD